MPAALRERHYALLFWGQATSYLGDWLFLVALPFAALGLGATTTQVGLVLAAQMVPFIFLTLLGGAWADRLGRRRVMLVADAARAVIQAVGGILLITGSAQLWHLAALAALYGAADSFFAPASIGLIPATVPVDLVQDANALLSLSRNVARLLGAPLGGVIVAVFGPGDAFLIDAGTFVVSAALLARMRLSSPQRAEEPEPTLQAIAAGWREVRRQSWIARFLVLFVIYHGVVLPAVLVLGPIFANEQLDGARSWGFILGGFAVGAIAGGLLALRRRPHNPLRAIAAALVLASLQAAIVALGHVTLVIAALIALSGGAIVFAIAVWDTTVQQRVPEHLLSRVSSFDFFASVGALPIGMALIGPIAGAAGLRTTMVAASAVGVTAAGLYALRAWEGVDAVEPALHARGRGE